MESLPENLALKPRDVYETVAASHIGPKRGTRYKWEELAENSDEGMTVITSCAKIANIFNGELLKYVQSHPKTATRLTGEKKLTVSNHALYEIFELTVEFEISPAKDGITSFTVKAPCNRFPFSNLMKVTPARSPADMMREIREASRKALENAEAYASKMQEAAELIQKADNK